MKKRYKYSALSLFTLPALASAHTGHADTGGLVSGFMHTVTGIDHLLAMVAIGIWLVHSQRRYSIVQPLVVVSAMLIGAILGVFGFGFSGVEWGIAASVLLLGLAITFRLPTVLFTQVPLILFAGCHGLAHGIEIPVGQNAVTFFTGFSLAALGLMSMGMAAASAMNRFRSERISVLFGLSCAGVGGGLLAFL